MKLLSSSLLAAMALTFTALAAQAQDGAASMPHADKRAARQQARIASGAANGSLTAKETQNLEKRQAAVNQAEANAKADGTVTKQERRHVARMQDRNSRAIHHQKHDAQNAPATPAK